MIINPFQHKERLKPIPGTRILPEDFGLLRTLLEDTVNPARLWRVVGVYSPLSARSAAGLRVKVIDEQGFITFVEQMQLEVLLGEGRPGELCPWSGKRYQPSDHHMFDGFVMDDDDLLDDLLDREHILRASCVNGVIPNTANITRKVHLGDGEEFEDTLIMLYDGDQETGLHPDYRQDTLMNRWSRSERNRARWKAP